MMQSTDAVSPQPAAPLASPQPRPWGVIASILWVVLAFEVVNRLLDRVFATAPLQALEHDSRIWHAVNLLTAWTAQLLVIVVAVALTRRPIAAYLGWRRPRAKDVVFGLAVILAWSLVLDGVAYFATGNAFNVQDYRAALAAGTSPWWYVLQWWPAIICAPIVEESALRGFMWTGLEDRPAASPPSWSVRCTSPACTTTII